MVAFIAQTRPTKQWKTPMALSKERLCWRSILKKSMSQCPWHSNSLYELQCKKGLLKGRKTPESGKALEARVAMQESKTENISGECLFGDEKPKANDRNNQPLTKRIAAPDRAMQSLDGYGYWEWTVSPLSWKTVCWASDFHLSYKGSSFSYK